MARMTRLVVVFTLFTSFTNSCIQLIVEDQQTNRLALDFLIAFAHLRTKFSVGPPEVRCASLGA
jgi:hypothetical protein